MMPSASSMTPERYRHKVFVDRVERLSQIWSSDHRVVLLDFRNTPFAQSLPHTRMAMHLVEEHLRDHEGEVHRLGQSFLACLADGKQMERVKTVMGHVLALAPGRPWPPADCEPEKAFAQMVDLHKDQAKLKVMLARLSSVIEGQDREAARAKMAAENAALANPLTGGVAAKAEDPFAAARFAPVVQLEFIEGQLGQIAFAELLRGQPICRVAADDSVQVATQEVYTSIADLQKRFSTSIDMNANYLLRQHLTEQLDALLLGQLKDGRLIDQCQRLNINVSLGALRSVAFRDFDAAIGDRRSKLTLEVGATDALAHSADYREIAPKLRAMGYGLGLDGVTFDILDAFELERLPLTLIKLTWQGERPLSQAARDRLDRLKQAGMLVALSGAHHPSAVAWGRSHGIDHFQGAMVDEMAAQLLHGACPSAQALKCTPDRCRNLHWAIHRMRNFACPRPMWASPAK